MGKHLITFIFGLICTQVCLARVDLTRTQKLDMPAAQKTEILSQAFVNKVLPTEAREGEGHQVLSKMADSTLAYWWETTPLRNTSLGRAAESIEKKARLQGEIHDTNEVTHKFDLKVLVMQTLARFEYKGWFNAGVNYDARASETIAEITQPLAKDKDLVVSQKFNNNESTSRLSFNYNW
jgi:hypothetical protein